jgi:hypothetical protein
MTQSQSLAQQQQPSSTAASTTAHNAARVGQSGINKRTHANMQGNGEATPNHSNVTNTEHESNHQKYAPLANMFDSFCAQQKQLNHEFNVNSLVRPTVPVSHLTSRYQPNEAVHDINNNNNNMVSSRSSVSQPGYSKQPEATQNIYPDMSDIFKTLDNQTLTGTVFPTVDLASRTHAYSKMV